MSQIKRKSYTVFLNQKQNGLNKSLPTDSRFARKLFSCYDYFWGFSKFTHLSRKVFLINVQGSNV